MSVMYQILLSNIFDHDRLCDSMSKPLKEASAEKARKEGLSTDPYELLGIDKLATDAEVTKRAPISWKIFQRL